MVVKRFDMTFSAGTLFHLFVFYKPYTVCDFPKALPAKHQVIAAD